MRKIKKKNILESKVDKISDNVGTLTGKVDRLVVSIKNLGKRMDSKFEDLTLKMESKFEGVGQEFVKVYEKFDKIETTMGHKFDGVNGRLTSVKKRLWAVELKQ